MRYDGATPVDLRGFRESMEQAGIGEIVDVTIDVYLDEAAKLFAQLLEAADDGDLAVVEARAHTLKSSSANVWAKELSSMFAGMEGAARQSASEAVSAAIEPLRSEFDDVVRYLEQSRAAS